MGEGSTPPDAAPAGPLVDVETPLRNVRDHALKDMAAWLAAIAIVMLFLAVAGSVVGWPQPDYRVEAYAVGFEPVAGGTIVEFRGEGGGFEVQWTRRVEENRWEFGERTEGWVDDGLFYAEHGPSLTGPADFYLLVLWAALAGWAVRRWIAIELALTDATRGRERPRRGYAALVANPLPRSWRAVLLVWHADPVKPGGGLAPPDDTLLADDDVGPKPRGGGVVQVWEAWVDTGRSRWSRPRWIAVRDGVFVPHRRALMAGQVAYRHVQHLDVLPPVPLGPQNPPAGDSPAPGPRHRFGGMLVWRLAAVVACAALSLNLVDPSGRVTILTGP